MHQSTLFTRVLGLVLAFLSGCASVDRLGAPPLVGTPTDSALVVVKVDASMHGMLGITSSQSVRSGVLLSTDGRRRIDGSAVSGLVIFSNVPPGEYNLAGVEASWTAGTMTNIHRYAVPPESAIELVFTVKTGDPRFVGPVAVQEFRQTDNRGVRFSLKSDKRAEQDAWTQFGTLYPNSVWARSIQERLEELRY